MSISHTDISSALRAAGYNPDDCKVTYDPPSPDHENVTTRLDLSPSVLRDLATEGLEVYAPKSVGLIAKVQRVANRILNREESQ